MINPMHPTENWKLALEKAHKSVRCKARTRKNTNCQAPAMKNGRCRMHGGKSTGAPTGEAHGRYVHGFYTAENQEELKKDNLLLKQAKEILKSQWV